MSEGEIQKTESETEYLQEIFKTDLHFFILSSNKWKEFYNAKIIKEIKTRMGVLSESHHRQKNLQ